VVFKLISQKIGALFSVNKNASGLASIAENQKWARMFHELVDLKIKQGCAVGGGECVACYGVFHGGERVRFFFEIINLFFHFDENSLRNEPETWGDHHHKETILQPSGAFDEEKSRAAKDGAGKEKETFKYCVFHGGERVRFFYASVKFFSSSIASREEISSSILSQPSQSEKSSQSSIWRRRLSMAMMSDVVDMKER
jgi:hypothetical protein